MALQTCPRLDLDGLHTPPDQSLGRGIPQVGWFTLSGAIPESESTPREWAISPSLKGDLDSMGVSTIRALKIISLVILLPCLKYIKGSLLLGTAFKAFQDLTPSYIFIPVSLLKATKMATNESPLECSLFPPFLFTQVNEATCLCAACTPHTSNLAQISQLSDLHV